MDHGIGLKLDAGVLTSISCESSEDAKEKLPDRSSLGADLRDVESVVTCDLDRAVAALESSENALQESVSKDGYIELATDPQNQSAPEQRRLSASSGNNNNEEPSRTRDFNELLAIFAQSNGNQKVTVCNRAHSPGLDLTPVREQPCHDSARHERDIERSEITTNNDRHDGDNSIVSRMKKNFETESTINNLDQSRQRKPVSFEVSLENCVTRDCVTRDNFPPVQKKDETVSSDAFCIDDISRDFEISPRENHSLTKGSPSETFRTISSTTGSPSIESRDISFTIENESNLFKSISPTTKRSDVSNLSSITDSSVSKSISFEISFNEEPVRIKPKASTPTRSKQGVNKDMSLSNETDCTQDVSQKSCSFEISFDDDSPKKSSPNQQLRKISSKTSKPEKGAPFTEITDKDSGSASREDLTGSSSVSSPRCLPFEMNFDSNKRTTSRQQSENNSYSDSTKSLVVKDGPISVQKSRVNVSKNTAAILSLSQRDVSPEKETSEVKGRLLLQADEETLSESDNTSRTRGISFDVSFDEDLQNRKHKLAPSRIRLKMSKTKQKRNPETHEQSESVNLGTESTATHILQPKEARRDRDTYTLDEVSSTLQIAYESGITLEQALDNLSRSHGLTHEEHLKTSEDVSTPKRGTYSLDQVSDCLVEAAQKGMTVEQALGALADSQETNNHLESKVESAPKRDTYDLAEVSRNIDSKKKKGKSLEEALEQLLDEVENAVKSPQKTTMKRGTYDLEDVSQTVQHDSDRGVPVEESLDKIAVGSSSGLNTSPQIKSSSIFTACERSCNLSSEMREHNLEKRGTYNLDDVAEHLGSASEKGKSITETLRSISNSEPKNTEKADALSRNTYTLDEVAQSLEIAKSKGIPVVEALNKVSSGTFPDDLSTPGSRGTYTLDEVAHSLESARNEGLPIVLALENLVMEGADSLKGPAEAAVLRRQGKLTNRKTYALASPLETIGEENQLRLFDGTTRTFLPLTQGFDGQLSQDDAALSAEANVVQTLDLLTSACEALLKTPPKSDPESNENLQSKAESRDSGVSFHSTGSHRGTYSLDDVSESLKEAKEEGIPVVDALASLTAPKPVKAFRIPRAMRKAASSKSDSSLTSNSVENEGASRQTYSLEGVSSSVEAAKAKGIPVIAALDELTNSLAQFSATGAKALKNGRKPIKKPDRPSILRKREAARLERSGIKSEAGRELERPMGMSFPISYPPAMRNSYSLDDVASAFETAYQTGASFQDVLDGRTTSNITRKDSSGARSSESFKTVEEKEELQSKPDPSALPSSSSDGQISSYLRKDSGSSEGSFSCSSSAGSTKDLSSAEDLVGRKLPRKQRKLSNGPFQLRRTRRSKTNRKLNVSPSPLHEVSIECVNSSESSGSDTSLTKRGTYDLKKVSEELDTFAVQGIPVVKSLDKLNTTNFLEKDSSKDVLHPPKRGTYSLEDLSERLDQAGTQGRSINQSLESLSKDNEVRASIDSGIVTVDSLQQSHQDPANTISVVTDSLPNRGTYSLEDISKRIDCSASEGLTVNKALLELSQGNLTSDKTARNTFTLDHVEDSINHAAERGLPVVDVLDKLSTSSDQQPNRRAENVKPRRKPFVKPKWQGSTQKEFFIEFFPSKADTKPSKPKLQNSDTSEVTQKPKESIDEQEVKSLESKTNTDMTSIEVVKTSEFKISGQNPLQLRSSSLSEDQNILDQTSSTSVEAKTPTSLGDAQNQEEAETQTSSTSIETKTPTSLRDAQSQEEPETQTCSTSIEAEIPTSLRDAQNQEEPETENQSSSSVKDATDLQESNSSHSRWQRSGSYVEALDSFEEMLKSEQDLPEQVMISTCPSDQGHSDQVPMKDCQYQGETYDVMLPVTSSGGRSTWRPSGSVLEQILRLMDDAEENGLSIADALEQAADMSEQEGEIEESTTNDIEDEIATPQHLTLLRLQFEEKRRQIEADKRRSQEQWEDERRRLGETAFWYTIGRAQGGDKETYNRPGHERTPSHEPASPGQPTPPIGRSTPFESMSPLQTKPSYQSASGEGYQSPRGNLVPTQPTLGLGYHQVPLHRPGHQSPAQSGHQSPVTSQGSFQFPSQPVATNFPHGSQSNGFDQGYETHEFRLSENPPEVRTHQNTSPLQQSPHQNGPMKSPSRKCWEVNPTVPPSPTTAFTPPSEGVALHVEDIREEQGDNLYDDVTDVQNKKGVAMFIGDESDKPKEGLTPEQMKKRERFMKSRQKKQEEEKARKDAENEKKKLRELKQKEGEEQRRHEEAQREEQQRRMKLSRGKLVTSHGGDSTYRPGPGANQQEDHSAFAEFSGPRCYVKPSGKSNRKLITNAISHVCLSGTVNKENKEKCLQAMADSPGFHFIVLFKDGLKFRGLYMLNPETEQGFKVFGIGPKVIASKMVDCVYKYSSGGKEFIKIPSKTLSISVDGVAIQKTYWQSNKPSVASKTQSNLKRPPRPPQR